MVRISKYLSKHLRHHPERLGLALAPDGWVWVDVLLAVCAAHNFLLSREELEEVVARNDKRRFSFNETGERIRADQGHSTEVNLQLAAAAPPSVLYHGTGEHSVRMILEGGLRRMARHHVHLAWDVETAKRVGARHGRPVVLEVDASGMVEAGHEFYVSANGVWLVERVAPQYLRII